MKYNVVKYGRGVKGMALVLEEQPSSFQKLWRRYFDPPVLRVRTFACRVGISLEWYELFGDRYHLVDTGMQLWLANLTDELDFNAG
jgi:hypothetical protein